MDEIMNVCRLCLGSDNLKSVFDNTDIPDNILNIIQVSTGVSITPTDNVSQKLCHKCLHITIKMFKFRSSSIINDKQLKAKAEKKSRPVLHKSVEMLTRKYPRIVLPSSITNTNISPVVTIYTNDIMKWMKNSQVVKNWHNKRIDTAQLATESTNQSDDVTDLENRIMPYLIPNKEIRLHIPEETENVSPTVPKLTSEIIQQQKQSQIVNSSYNDGKEILESSLSFKIRGDDKKRRLSEELTSAKRLKSNADFENGDNSVESLVTLKYVTKSLLICDICNGILYTSKDLKKHKLNHMKCHLCKKTFRSLEETKRHRDNECDIKIIMNNLPTIKLQRCDQSEEIRKQYPLLFDDPNETTEKMEVCSSLLVESQIKHIEETEMDFVEEALAKVEQTDVSVDIESDSKFITEISLISDDESEDQSSNDIPCNNRLGISTVINLKSDGEDPFKYVDTGMKINSAAEKKISKPQILSNASVRPDINIIGENIIDVNLDDDERNILKYILKRTKRGLKDTVVQTDLPCNEDIQLSTDKNKLYNLKNLHKFLSCNKIPVNLFFSPQLSMKLTSEPSPLLKKGGRWSKHVTKRTAPSEPLPVKNTGHTDTTTYQFINSFSSQVQSTSSSIGNQIPSNNLIFNVPADVAQQSTIGNQIASNNLIFNVPTDAVQQSSVGNLQQDQNSGITSFLVPTMLPTANYPQINNTFSLIGHSTLGTLAVMNPNSSSETGVHKSHHNAITEHDYVLPDYSILAQALSNRNLIQNNGLQNNVTSNSIISTNATAGQLMYNNIQTPQNMRITCNRYSLLKPGVKNPDGINSNYTTNKDTIQPRPKKLVIIAPKKHKDDVLSSTPCQTKSDSSLRTVTSHSKPVRSSNVPVIRVKNLSELQ